MAHVTDGFGRFGQNDASEIDERVEESTLPAPGKVSLTARLHPNGAAESDDDVALPSYLLHDPGVGRVPYQRDMQHAFGVDFSDIDVRLGGAGGWGDSAHARVENGRDVVAFDSTSPSREQVAHELTHVVQRRRFGEGTRGGSSHFDAAEHEARDLAPIAAAGRPVTVHAAPAARVQFDARVAQNIHDKLHGFPFDDEPGALADLRADHDRANTCRDYFGRYGVTLWDDFISQASGDTLNQALALLWPHMTLLDRLHTRLGTFDDDETGILQTIQSASDAELRTARSGILPYIMQLEPTDRFTARQRVWPERAVDNVGHLLTEGRGYVWDDEGPVATAIMNMTPDQRLTVWQRFETQIRAMFSDHDAGQIRAMCVGEHGGPTTDDVAIERRMQLATDGAGTDEDGVVAAVAAAGSRRDEAERIRVTLDHGRAPNGQPLTDSQIQSLNARLREVEHVEGRLLTPTVGAGGRLDRGTFLGRVEDEVDAGTTASALTTARVDAFTRAKQALLLTMGELRIDVDEEAALRILREVRGDADLRPGETLETVPAEELRRRRDASTLAIRQRLLRDSDLQPVWRALRFGTLSSEDADYATALGAGDTYAAALYELEHAFEHVDTDEAALLRIVRDLPAADRRRLLAENPPILQRIAHYPFADRQFHAAFGEVLRTGRIPTSLGLDAAMGGDWDGTDVEMTNEVLGNMSDAERTQYRRGYLLFQQRQRGGAGSASRLSTEDQAALDAYQTLYRRLRSELSDEQLDTALESMIGLPSVADMQSDTGRMQAATIMLERQRQRLEMGAALTDFLTTTDDTAAIAHVEFESRYNAAIADAVMDENEFAVLVALDQQFNTRFREHADTANMVSEIAGTVAAVVAAAVVIIASGGAATAATPGVVAWLSANSTLIAASAATSALSQVVASEAFGGAFNEATGADGARQAISGAINGALAVCGAALAEQAASMVGLSGRALTAHIARAAAGATERSVAGQAFQRGALIGLIDGSLGGAVGELAMTLTDADTWRRSVWDVLARAGMSLLRGGLLGGVGGAATGGLLEMATGLLQARALRGVAVSIDDSMGSSLHINFNIDEETGAISNLAMRMGPHATEGDIAAHVERLAVIRRASEVLSEARRISSISGHAEQEVAKIQPMINERLAQLRTPLSPQSREMIEAELDVMAENLAEFRRVAESGDASLGSGHIGRPDAPPGYPAPPAGHYYRRRGDGWDLQLYPDLDEAHPRFTLEQNGTTRTGRPRWRIVAREGASSEAVSFAEGTTRAQAFDLLTGPNSRSSFKQYWEMLEREGLATRQQVITNMMDPSGRTEDAVRHALKEYFEPRVLQRCMRDGDRVLTEAESMAQLRLMTRDLNSSDRGNLTEAWYLNRHSGLSPHPTMTAEANPGVVGRGGRGVRNPDFLEGQTLVELKATRSGLSAEEIEQIGDDLLVCTNRGTVTIDGDLVQPVRSLRLVFANVEGARGSADQLAEWIREHAFFTIEVYGRTGAATRISRANLGSLQREYGVSSLQALLGAL